MWISSEGVLSDSIRFQESTLQEETLLLDNLDQVAKAAYNDEVERRRNLEVMDSGGGFQGGPSQMG